MIISALIFVTAIERDGDEPFGRLEFRVLEPPVAHQESQGPGQAPASAVFEAMDGQGDNPAVFRGRTDQERWASMAAGVLLGSAVAQGNAAGSADKTLNPRDSQPAAPAETGVLKAIECTATASAGPRQEKPQNLIRE